ncbi:hypothetical protein NE237_006681 [Protea cynaroides]|uniref:Uncharacterized protein n=1 Tax=Protea cynaroides TaxID=273540 RepID=A0A9Q0KMV0_9MAGN|nr:hypothetical protein NE237_006681 [Protea cynaroides]
MFMRMGDYLLMPTIYFLMARFQSSSEQEGNFSLRMNLFWLGVEGGGFVLDLFLSLLFLRWRTRTSTHGKLSIPKIELFLLILMLPCISQSSAFVISGVQQGNHHGALLLAIPTDYSPCLVSGSIPCNCSVHWWFCSVQRRKT